MSINHLETWVLAQVGLEVALLLLLAFFLLRIRNLDKILENSRQEEERLRGLLGQLSEQMASWEKKQALLEVTLLRLSGRKSGLRERSAPTEGPLSGSDNSTSPRPGGSSLRLQVENLHLQGFSPAEIARHLGLNPTEVKMALELSRLKEETP